MTRSTRNSVTSMASETSVPASGGPAPRDAIGASSVVPDGGEDFNDILPALRSATESARRTAMLSPSKRISELAQQMRDKVAGDSGGGQIIFTADGAADDDDADVAPDVETEQEDVPDEGIDEEETRPSAPTMDGDDDGGAGPPGPLVALPPMPSPAYDVGAVFAPLDEEKEGLIMEINDESMLTEGIEDAHAAVSVLSALEREVLLSILGLMDRSQAQRHINRVTAQALEVVRTASADADELPGVRAELDEARSNLAERDKTIAGLEAELNRLGRAHRMLELEYRQLAAETDQRQTEPVAEVQPAETAADEPAVDEPEADEPAAVDVGEFADDDDEPAADEAPDVDLDDAFDEGIEPPESDPVTPVGAE